MTPRRLLFAFVLLLVAAVLWWQLTPPTPSAPTPTTEQPTTPVERAALEAPARPDGIERTLVAVDATSTANPRVRIEVVLPNGDAAVGALVRAGDREAVTDAQGTVELCTATGCDVTAKLGTLYGEGEWLEGWDGDVDRIRVTLAPDVHLVVVVTDTTGVPQPGVRTSVEATLVTRHGGLIEPTWVLTTDAHGSAEFPHLQNRLSYVAGLAADLWITASGSSCTPGAPHLAKRKVSWEDVVRDPNVHLVVPASGTVQIRVLDPNGQALHFDTTLDGDRGARFRADTEGDAEVFRMVPLGDTWSLWIDGIVASIRVRGPERANEVVKLDVPCPQHRWVFEGRVVRADGLAWPDEQHAEITLRDPRQPEPALATHIVALATPLELEAVLDRAELPRIEVTVQPGKNALAPAQSFLVERVLRAGVVDLGDLVMKTAPGLVELASLEALLDGRFVTHEVFVQLSFDDGGRDRPFPFVLRRRGDAAVLLGTEPSGPLRLDCWRFDCVAQEPTTLRRGEHHRITLQRAASLRVDLAHHELPEDALVAELVPADDPDADAELGSVHKDSVLWQRMTPGRYALCIRCGDHVLARAPNLVLAAGAQQWPVDRRPLELRSVRAMHVVARSGSATGRLLRVGVAEITADTTIDDELAWHEGWVLPQRTTTAVLVRALDHVPVRLETPTADVTLTLQPMTTVQLRAPDQVHVRIVTDGVADPLLRAADRDHEHRTTFHCPSDASLQFAPGTVLECKPVGDDRPAATRRVEVGRTSLQFITWE
ncbi:MAG: hypothetical protein JNK15_06690 [Planctomycetes bacterium]|nr:hypothetical protein [Planctomycetota bacterium]